MSPLRWGLIGASDIAATQMIPAMHARGDNVVAVQSASIAWASTFAARENISVAVTDLTHLLERDDIDAVYISSTNEKHHAQVLAAARHRKHILCEKPLALSVAHGQEMLAAANSSGIIFAVNHHLPGSATHRAMRALVAEGAIGEPLAVRVAHAVMLPERLRGWRLTNEPGSGVILDITCHDASAVQAILGRRSTHASGVAVSQGGWANESSAPDAVMATIRYEGNVLAQVHDAYTVEHAPTSLEVIGTEGALFGSGIMTSNPSGTVTLWSRGGDRDIDIPDRPDLYRFVLDAFADAIAGQGEPSVTAQAGFAAMATALAVQQSAQTGRTLAIEQLID